VIELDGHLAGVDEEAGRTAAACESAGATRLITATTAAERDALWEARRVLSYALRRIAPRKINHDVAVPRGRVPALYALVDALRRQYDLRIAAFGHAGDGNIHVNLLVDPADAAEMARAGAAEHALFSGVVALEGAITGEHGVGFAKAAHLGLQLAPAETALMARVKHAFDPHGVLNPGKMWETTPADLAGLNDGGFER
jgi:FAD/FMN-containing dehydrogenase